MSRLLLIEDDPSIAFNLKDYLSREGYEVEIASTLKETQSSGTKYDLFILDWMLPDGQGIDFLRALRKQGCWTPVLFLTAKADLIDRVLGLESGANDYLTKPFEPRELLARIRVHLRKSDSAPETLQGCDLILQLKSREASFRGKSLVLTRKEFDLLVLLLSHTQQVFSREELLNKVWGLENYPTTRTVDTHVLQIRQKTEEDLIQTVRGIGYRLKR